MRAVAVLLAALAVGAHGSWEIPEDLALGSANVVYKAFKDEWMVTFDGPHAAETFTYVIPQVCRAEASSCGIGQISFAHVACGSVADLLLDASWFNENAAADIDPVTTCPRSFQDATDAQVLLGSVMPETFVYVTVPLSLSIRNNETLLARFDRGGTAHEWSLTVRLLFLTEMLLGTERIFTVRRYVAHVALSKPDASLATLSVQSACAAVGLRAPLDAQLKMRTVADGSRVCVWVCRVDAMRTPWNSAPSPWGEGQCRPLPKYFTALEFAFIVDTNLQGVVPSRVSQAFLDSLDGFGARIEASLQKYETSLVAVTMPGSDFDTTPWREWLHEFIAFSHRHENVLGNNSTLVVEALRELGYYTETINPDFAYPSLRRYSVQDVTIKGVWFTRDVTTSTRALSKILQTTVASVPHTFPSAMQVQRIAQVDVAAAHRVAPLFSNQTEVEVRMQRGAIVTLEFLCLGGLVVAAGVRRCRDGA